MAAFVIAQYAVNNPALYQEYAAAAGPIVAQYGGELVAFDAAAETIEGKPPGAQTVVIKFDSVEAAKAWYNSSEYQAVVGKRIEATDGFLLISQSMNAG